MAMTCLRCGGEVKTVGVVCLDCWVEGTPGLLTYEEPDFAEKIMAREEARRQARRTSDTRSLSAVKPEPGGVGPLRDMVNDGWTTKQIAEYLGVHPVTVARLLRVQAQKCLAGRKGR
jgi:hypothetical protein